MPQSAGAPSVNTGYSKLANVTPNDTTPIGPCKSIYVNGTGNLAVIMPGNISFQLHRRSRRDVVADLPNPGQGDRHDGDRHRADVLIAVS